MSFLLPKQIICAPLPESVLSPPKYIGSPQKLKKKPQRLPTIQKGQPFTVDKSKTHIAQCSPIYCPTKSPPFASGATQITPSNTLSRHLCRVHQSHSHKYVGVRQRTQPKRKLTIQEKKIKNPKVSDTKLKRRGGDKLFYSIMFIPYAYMGLNRSGIQTYYGTELLGDYNQNNINK
jgi:hypothetical protein